MRSLFLIMLLLPELLAGQVVFDSIPKNKQLIPRDLLSNTGTLIVRGTVDNSGVDYNSIKVEVKKNGLFYDADSQVLSFNGGNMASFEIQLQLPAELSNYSVEVFGVKGANDTSERFVDEVVVGDVYVIQGQSNAEARMREGSASGYDSDFIRVYANGTDVASDLLANDQWYIADGDVDRTTSGNTGQWGLTLASLISSNQHVPVAIFNGAEGARNINYFQRPADYQTSLDSNYGRLYFRLKQNGLLGHVRAVIWSQGEHDGKIGTSLKTYTTRFNNLYNAWLEDFSSLEHVYIFQTSNGCGFDTFNLLKIKEAQRLIAESDTFIDIIPTSALQNWSDDCHFVFTGGYEEFGKRAYDLIAEDIYGESSGLEIRAPDILEAYLTGVNTLVVKTDAVNLSKDGDPVNNYLLEDANGAVVSGVEANGNSFVLSLDKDPGSAAKLSFIGPDFSGTEHFVRNSNELEVLSFYQFPIDDSRYTVWNGSSWTKGLPSASKYVTISGNYNGSNGGFKAKDLTIDSGADLYLDTGSSNSVEVYGDLNIFGSFVVGDTESLVMYDDDANVTGSILKKERSTNRSNTHDITYWSSPVSNETIGDVFNSVSPSRIFYFDQDQSSASDPNTPGYWNIWQLASGLMIPGQGYAAEGQMGTTGIHDVGFWGEPNNGPISYPLKGFFDDDTESGDQDNNFNLVGNPYPSAINITDLFDANADVMDETVYLWTHSTPVSGGTNGDFVSSDYATYNRSGGTACAPGGTIPRDTIGSGQGFFIRATSPGNLKFTNAMRRPDQNTIFFKPFDKEPKKQPVNKNRIWLNLTTDLGGFNQILISFDERGTYGYDKGYDAHKIINSNPVSFYSLGQGQKFTIQTLPPFIYDSKINLGFHANVFPRNFSIGIAKTEGALNNANIVLEDRKLHVFQDLRESDYHFEVFEEGDFPDRFLLHFPSDLSTIPENDSTPRIINTSIVKESLLVNANAVISRVKVYDVLGNLLVDEYFNYESISLDLNHVKNGKILLVSAYFDNGTMAYKKVFF